MNPQHIIPIHIPSRGSKKVNPLTYRITLQGTQGSAPQYPHLQLFKQTEREMEMENKREKYTLRCAGVGTVLSGALLGIKSACRWERVAATQLGGLETHFKFCWDDMSRPPLRPHWQRWQLASFNGSDLKAAESLSKLNCKRGCLHLYRGLFFLFPKSERCMQVFVFSKNNRDSGINLSQGNKLLTQSWPHSIHHLDCSDNARLHMNVLEMNCLSPGHSWLQFNACHESVAYLSLAEPLLYRDVNIFKLVEGSYCLPFFCNRISKNYTEESWSEMERNSGCVR